MTKAKFVFHNDQFHYFEISGHAEYNDEGLDIVCAGISATVITSLNLLIRLLNQNAKFSENQEEGYIYFEVVNQPLDPKDVNFMAIVVENLITSLQEIENMYPHHLKVKIENRR